MRLPVTLAAIFFLAAVAHLVALMVGARAAVVMGAPSWILDSLNTGTWLAPSLILGIAGILIYAAACVLSLAGLFERTLPLGRTFVWIFGLALLFRSAALPAIAIFVPRARPDIGLFEVATAIATALLGTSLFVVLARRSPGLSS